MLYGLKNTKEVNWNRNSLVTKILQNIYFCVLQNKEHKHRFGKTWINVRWVNDAILILGVNYSFKYNLCANNVLQEIQLSSICSAQNWWKFHAAFKWCQNSYIYEINGHGLNSTVSIITTGKCRILVDMTI